MRFFTREHVDNSFFETISVIAFCFLLLIICTDSSRAGHGRSKQKIRR